MPQKSQHDPSKLQQTSEPQITEETLIEYRDHDIYTRYLEHVLKQKPTKFLKTERYRTDEKYRKDTMERAKQRYHNDEAYRQATIERAKKRYAQKRAMQIQLDVLENSDEP